VEKCIGKLKVLKNNGGEIANGEVIAGQELFLSLFESSFLDSDDRNEERLSTSYLKSKDFINGLMVVDDSTTPRDLVIKQVCSTDLSGLIIYLTDLVDRAVTGRELDLRHSLIFILGNLDEAYDMSGDLNPDVSADDLHEATKRITVANIKNALASRFRSEQIARLGNNHFLYTAFSKPQFQELIRRELERITIFVKTQFDLNVEFDGTVNDVVFAEGVIPSQGTRPVFTTINNLVQSKIGTVVMHAHATRIPASIIRWSFRDGQFSFEMMTEERAVVSVMLEKVQLRLESQRISVDPHLQAHVAVHESGHAVLAALLLRIVPSVVVSRSASHDAEGFCRVRYPEGPFTRERLKKAIMITLGGLAAERLVFGEEYTCSGVSSDIDHASMLANDAVRRYAMGSDPIRMAVMRNYANEDYFVNVELYEKEAVKLIQDCMKIAEMTLDRNRLLLLKMSEYLTRNSRMDSKQIEEFVKKYSVEDWPTDKGFVQPKEYFSFDKILEGQLIELEASEHVLDEMVSESLA
jgi:cell division protease FtsH